MPTNPSLYAHRDFTSAEPLPYTTPTIPPSNPTPQPAEPSPAHLAVIFHAPINTHSSKLE